MVVFLIVGMIVFLRKYSIYFNCFLRGFVPHAFIKYLHVLYYYLSL